MPPSPLNETAERPAAVASTPVPDRHAQGPATPLIVDLDGTLLRTDTLFEAIADLLKRRPLWTLLQMLVLPFAIARTKAKLQGAARLDVDTLPENAEVLEYCYEARAAGRPVWLVSAADQKTVEMVAARFGVFDRAIGSDGKLNNKGGAKARLLAKECPQGFEYIGDSPADHKVWAAASHASVVGGGPSRLARIRKSGAQIVRQFERPKPTLRVWVKALRIHQWPKNALIFVAPLLAMTTLTADKMIACLIAFPLLGMMASGTYILNDLLDLQADRNHHSKRRRPFAAGKLKLWQGFVAAPLLIGVGLLGGFLLSLPFAVTMLAYLVVTCTYSFFLKRVPLLDAAILGFLFTLRLVMGGVLTGIPVSHWLVVLSMFLFFSLSLAKRHVEILRKAAAGQTSVANRGYTADDAPLTLGLGLAAATATPILVALYVIEAAWPEGAYSLPQALWVAPAVLSLWLMRIWLLANRAELDDDPVVFALRDVYSLALGAFLAVTLAFAAFGGDLIQGLSLPGTIGVS